MVRICSIDRLYSRRKVSTRSADHSFGGGATAYRLSASQIVGWERVAGEELRPELPGEGVHVALDAIGPGLGERQHLVGRQPGFELQLELLGEPLPAEPPVTGGSRQQVFFEPPLVV